MKKLLGPADYLKKILTAKVYDVAVESPLEPAKVLSRRLHNKVLLKREDQQAVFSFKLRGAYNKMAQLSPAERIEAILRWSALPGASRHHWGTDLDLIDAHAIQPGGHQRAKGEIGVGRGVGAAELDALGLGVGAVHRDAHGRRPVALRVDEVDRRLVTGDQAPV